MQQQAQSRNEKILRFMEKPAMQFELEVIGEQLYKALTDKAPELTAAMQHLCRHTDAVFPGVFKLVGEFGDSDGRPGGPSAGGGVVA